MDNQQKNKIMVGTVDQSLSDLQIGNDSDVNGEKDRLFVSALARGFEILRCFTPEVRVLGKQDLARLTGLPKATVFRLAYTLTRLGYLKQSKETGKYQLAGGVLSFGHSYLNNMNIIQVARPYMLELADQTHSAVYLAVRDRLSMVFLEACKDPNVTFTQNLQVGSRVPLATSSLGRALLCGLPEEERNYLMDHIHRQNELEWPKIEAGIERALKDYEHWGFCFSVGDWRQDINAVAIAIGPVAGPGMLSLTCSGPAFQLRQHMLEDDIGPRLLHTARNIEEKLAQI
ncbi:IclR family transcriptional regulator [Geopsychrobacter electrodiphilus]|uniref:IclR family transcriptional regulator n=1 Tax=Geopsychrobacter electrodiphilus TaxID=225196 RepID=UPI00036155B2|nr:IclR family transcriptional regulator [Geopsychrobacter electrodiphilus]